MFKGHTCITILDVPEKAQDSVDDIIYVTRLKSFVNQIDENKYTKDWLLKNGRHIEKTKNLKRCIINHPKDLSYNYLMNNFPIKAIKYIKNDSEYKKIIFKINKNRKNKTKIQYYYMYALLLLIPKNQILKLQEVLKHNKDSIFYVISNKGISKKQLELSYKQLTIILGEEPQCKYYKFNVKDNLCYDIVNDHLKNIILNYITQIKQTFRDKS